MDEETRLDLDDAIGKSNALLCLLPALVGMLVEKKLLAHADAALLTGLASAALKIAPNMSDDARALGESALKGFAGAWTAHVTRH
jgi:hypothetical protein